MPSASNVSSASREVAPLSQTQAVGSSFAVISDNTGVGNGPGPLRHPRPLTTSELHLQLEREQEAVVNRLTRELSALRQQSASVASTASSTSASITENADYTTGHTTLGSSHPTPSRRHRSSSSLSTRSVNNSASTSNALISSNSHMLGNTVGVSGSTTSGITPARDSLGATSLSQARESLSRHNSLASSKPSGASSPSLFASLAHGDSSSVVLQHRQSSSSQPGSISVSPRYEEIAYHRTELESAKRENEALRRRIRDLERDLNGR